MRVGKAIHLAVILRLALGFDRLVIVLHVEGLQVVFELNVERTLRGGEGDGHALLAPWNLVNLGDVLPNKTVEEGLGRRVTRLVPRGSVRV